MEATSTLVQTDSKQVIRCVNDRALIQRYLHQQDVAALRELLGGHEDGLFRYLQKMLRHQQDSEDALQDTFRKALAALPEYREENHFKSWLFRIGHNTALEVIRRRRKIVKMPDVADAEFETPSDGPRETMIRRERAERLREAVAALPQHERAVVLLRLEQDLSFREIAEIVEAPLGTVLARMHKAKERLKTQLANAIT